MEFFVAIYITAWLIFLLYCVHGLVYGVKGLRRNSQVRDFRKYVLHLSSEFEKENMHAWKGYHRHYAKLPSYEEQLEDDKPLELSTYFTPAEAMELLTSRPTEAVY